MNIKIIFLIFITFYNLISYSQVTRVVYKYDFCDRESSEKSFKENKENLPDYVMSIVAKTFEDSFKKEYELLFNKTQAVFFKTNAITNGSFSINDNDIYFIDLAKKEKVYQTNVDGKVINVIPQFPQYDWQITAETKIISGYKCFKATLEKFDSIKIDGKLVTFKRYVWFTPEIPASFGPVGFDGLPGLVLETGENDKISLRAVKIEFDYDKNVKIVKPVANKSISLAEYEAIEKKNLKEMQDEIGN